MALAALVAVAAFLRFWQLDTIPPGYHYDEAFQGLEAWNLLTRPYYHPIFFPGNFGNEPLFIYLTALAFRLFGAGPTTQRAVAALLGTLTVPALYGLARELLRADERLPRSFPLLSAASLAILYWHLHFSRVGIHPVLLPLILVLAFWALWRGLRTRGICSFVVAGVFVGLGAYTYLAGRLLLPLAGAFAALMWLLNRAQLRRCWRGLTLALLVALLVMAPLGLYFWRNPHLLTLRTSQVAAAGEGEGGLLGSVLHTLGMFSVAGDANPRSNLPNRPALDGFIALPFYLGVVIACGRLVGIGGERSGTGYCGGRTAWGFVLLAGAVMLSPTVLSEYAPHFRRAVGAAPAVALLIGLGLASIVAWGKRRWKRRKEGERGKREGLSPCFLVSLFLVSLSLLGSSFVTARDYFHRWANFPDLYHAFDVGLWEIAQYVNELPPEELVYVTPRAADHTTLAFAWREGLGTRHFDGRHAFIAPARYPLADRPATYVIIVHEDFRGSLLLRELYPQAKRVHEFRDRDGRPYGEVFRLASGGRPARAAQQDRLAIWEGISLEGYDLDASRYHPGSIVYLQLWWACDAQVTRDWKVFTHLLGPAKPDGSYVWAGDDAEPGQGSVPTSTWQIGELILDEHQLPLPADLPPGEYLLEIGLYEANSGRRAAVLVSPLDDPDVPPDKWLTADHVILGGVTVISDQ